MAIGAANLIATVIALRVIDKVGRKKLLLIGAIGTACALAGVALIFATGDGKPYSCWPCSSPSLHFSHSRRAR